MTYNELIQILKLAKVIPPKLSNLYDNYINAKESDQKVSQPELKTIYEALNDYKEIDKEHEFYPFLIQLETATGFLIHELNNNNDPSFKEKILQCPSLPIEVKLAIDYATEQLDFYHINYQDGILLKKIIEDMSLDGLADRFSYRKQHLPWHYSSIINHIIKKYLASEEADILNKMQKDNIDSDNTDNLIQYLTNKLQENTGSYILKKLLIQAKISKEMQLANPNKPPFPFSEIWRFVIDGNKESEGAYIFENETGYIAGALNGLLYALQTRNQAKDKDWYIQLHDVCVNDVYQSDSLLSELCINEDKFMNYSGSTNKQIKPFIKNIRDENSSGQFGYGYLLLDQDDEGVDDLKLTSREDWILVDDSLFRIYILKKTTQEIQIRLTSLFNKYNQLLQHAQDPAERLICHLWLSRELEIHHVFMDANGRSSLLAAINMVLGDGLPLMLFDDPNVFDANSPKNLCQHAINAMKRYQDYCHINNENIDSLNASMAEKFKTTNSWSEILQKIMLNNISVSTQSLLRYQAANTSSSTTQDIQYQSKFNKN